MAHTLRLEEMVDSLHQMGETAYAGIFRRQLELVGTQMAEIIASKLDIDYGPARCEQVEFAGCCATFHPKRADQEEPPFPINQYDSDGEWEDDLQHLRDRIAAEKHTAQMADLEEEYPPDDPNTNALSGFQRT